MIVKYLSGNAPFFAAGLPLSEKVYLMGVDIHALRFLQYAVSNEPLGAVVTLGRQCVHIDPRDQSKLLKPAPAKPYGPYCEDMLIERLSASSVTSFDASDYEGATVVHDMNTPLQPARQFDTVIDLGTLEHVFNVPVALRNVAALCKKGGRIIHVLPANNYSGHGFYQFSPELFFSVYAKKNGFAGTEVFVSEVTDLNHWWKSAEPTNGKRIEFTSRQRSYVFSIARKVEYETGQSVQQSDYIANWQGNEIDPTLKRRSFRDNLYRLLRKTPILWRYAKPVNTHEDAAYHRLSSRNPGYRRVRISDLI